MDFQELYERFYKMEGRENLFDYRVRNRVVWDYLRYYVFKELEKGQSLPGQIVYRKKIRPLVHVMDGIGFIRRRRLSPPYDIVVVNYSRKTMIDGKSVNSQFYLTINALKDRYRILLIDPSRYREEVEKFYGCDVVRSIPWHYRAKLGGALMRYSGEEKRVFDTIRKVVLNEFQVGLDMDAIVRLGFSYQLGLGKEFAKIFKRVRPRLILYSETGGCKGWIEEAHRLEIPVVEYQHSIIWRGSVLCNYDNGVVSRDLKTLHDYIFTFAESWHPQYICPAKKIPVGHPLIDRHLSGLAKSSGRPEAILFISTKRSGRVLERLALELSRRMPGRPIFYKLRPDEYIGWREAYSREFCESRDVTVIDRDIKSLYDWFAESGYIVGDASMAVVEGMAAGLVPFILKNQLHVVLENYVKQGAAFLVETAEEIEMKIKQKELPRNPLRREQLFRPGSLSNITQAVDAIFRSKGEERNHGSIS